MKSLEFTKMSKSQIDFSLLNLHSNKKSGVQIKNCEIKFKILGASTEFRVQNQNF